MRRFVLAFALFVGVVRLSHAQDLGFPPYGSFENGGFDSINRQNLDVHFAIPLVSVPGRGTVFSAALVYDSIIWQEAYSNGSWTWVPRTTNSGLPLFGWRLGVPTAGTTSLTEVVLCVTKPYSTIHHYGYVFTDPSGTTHSFPIDFYNSSCGGNTDPRTGYASDDSGFYVDASAPNAPIVWGPDGLKYSLSGQDQQLTDTNGNIVTQHWVSSTETDWIDTAGRAVLKQLASPDWTDYQYQDTTGTYQTIRVYYSSTPVRTAFGCPGVVEFNGVGNQRLPSSVVMPNGATYSFTYEPTPGAVGYTTGQLLRVTLPTGGYYDYARTGSNDGVICSDGSASGLVRTINDGTTSSAWTYARQALTGGSWQTTITTPILPYDSTANAAQYTFDSSNRETERRVFQGLNIYGSPLVTVDTTYPTGHRTLLSQTTILADDRRSMVSVAYDTLSMPTFIYEYDWGVHQVGPIVRQKTITYLRSSPYTSRQINNRVSAVTIRDWTNNGTTNTVIYSETVAYDGSSLTCVTGAAQHDDTNYPCSFVSRGNVSSRTEYSDAANGAAPVTKVYTYDSLGNARTATADSCQLQSWSYSSSSQYAYPDSETNGAPGGPQLVTSTGYNVYTGLMSSTTDANSKTTAYTYDSVKRLLTIQRPDLSIVSNTYSDTSPSTLAVRSPIDSVTAQRTVTVFDGLGRPVRSTVTNGDGSVTYSIVDQQFDPVGDPYRLSNPYTGAPVYWTETRRDALGRPLVVIPPDGSISSNNMSYSYSGVAQTQTDPAGHQKRFDYDALGRLAKVTEPDPSSGQLAWDTFFTYNGLDQVKTVTQDIQTRTFTYDGLGRLVSVTTPEAGTESLQYNEYGLVTQRTDARGVITQYQYNTLNLPILVSYNVGATGVPSTGSVTYTYGTSASANNNGRVTSMTDGSGDESYTYDAVGHVTQVARTLAGVSYTTNYAYDFRGELRTVTYPSGRQVQRTVDAVGRVATVQFNGANVVSGVSYNAAQQVTGFTLGNGIAATLSFSPQRLQLTSRGYTKAGFTLPTYYYSYTQPNGGNNGQITLVTDSARPGRSVAYSYDSLDRLAAAESAGSADDPEWALAWSYDRFGNRLGQSVLAGTPPGNVLTVSPTTNRITSNGYQYDASGNLTGSPGASLAADAEGRVVSYTAGSQSSYGFDGNGLRVQKSSGGSSTVYIYAGSKVIAEYLAGASASSPLAEYVYSGDDLVATFDGTMKYHLLDHMSVRGSTDNVGNLVSESGHFPFGESWYATNGGTKWMFAGYERDAESGMDYAIARFRNPISGTFTSADPILGSQRTPQSLNRFAYVSDDPINQVDPLGLMTPEICKYDPLDWSCGGGGASVAMESLTVWGTPIVIAGVPSEIAIYGFLGYTILIDGIDPSGPGPSNAHPAGGSSPQSPNKPDDNCSVSKCLADCAAEEFGLTTAAGVVGTLLTSPLIPKSRLGGALGSSAGTSVASKVFRSLVPGEFPGATWAPTAGNWFARTESIGAALGRWSGVVSVALLVSNAVDISVCTSECASCGGK